MKNVIKREFSYFLASVLFFTRVPLPKWMTGDFEMIKISLSGATRYFPLIGLFHGGLYWVVLLLSPRYLDLDIALLLALIAGIFFTGCFHEDGLADSCDALGGGMTREKIFEIMKDSRIGSYGAVALILFFMLKFFLLRSLVITEGVQLNWLLFAQMVPRTISALCMTFLNRVNIDQAKSKDLSPQRKLADWLTPLLLTAPILLIISKIHLVSLLPLLLTTALFSRYLYKKIGGYTGDTLGALLLINELTIYISWHLIWKLS